MYQVAIASYGRPEALVKKTLNTLTMGGVDLSRVTVFVADKEQYALYQSVIPGSVGLVIAEPGMREVRNFIMRYYAPGTHVFSIDDDIRGFNRKIGANRMQPVTDVHSMIREGFQCMASAGLRLWGIYPTANGMFMKHEPTFDLRHIVGSAYGFVVDHSIEITAEYKTDYDLTMAYYMRDGGVVRMNMYAPKTTYYHGKGGCNTNRTPANVEASVVHLEQKYPGRVRRNARRKSDYLEILLVP